MIWRRLRGLGRQLFALLLCTLLSTSTCEHQIMEINSLYVLHGLRIASAFAFFVLLYPTIIQRTGFSPQHKQLPRAGFASWSSQPLFWHHHHHHQSCPSAFLTNQWPPPPRPVNLEWKKGFHSSAEDDTFICYVSEESLARSKIRCGRRARGRQAEGALDSTPPPSYRVHRSSSSSRRRQRKIIRRRSKGMGNLCIYI